MSEDLPANSADADEPKIFALNRKGNSWKLSRRSFLGTAAATAAVTGCGSGDEAVQEVDPAVAQQEEAARGVVPKAQHEDLRDGTPIENIPKDCRDVYAHTDRVTRLAVSADGTRLLSASKDKTIKLWSLPDGALIQQVTKSNKTISALIFGANRNQVIWSNLGSDILGDSELWFWESPDKSPRKVGLARGIVLQNLAASADGQGQVVKYLKAGKHIVASCSLPKGTNTEVLTINDRIHSLQVCLKKGLVAGCDNESVLQWSLNSKQTPPKILQGHNEEVELLAFNHDGSLLASAGRDGEIILWNSDGQIDKKLPGSINTLAAMQFIEPETPGTKGKQLITVGRRVKFDLDEYVINIWSLEAGNLMKSIIFRKPYFDSVAITPDGKYVIVGAYKSVHIYSLPEGKHAVCLLDLKASKSNVKGIEYQHKTETGETISYTLPCGSPMPAGAVCVCNCVPGSYTVSTPRRTTYSTSYWYPN